MSTRKKITLSSPLLVNGKERTEFEYDAQEITAEQFIEACQKAASMDKARTISLKAKENDYALHLYLGFYAIIAVNPEVSVEDLERVKGFDTLAIADIGWLFTLRKSGEISEESNSDEQSDNTAKLSTQAQENSGTVD